jgi:ABC-type multidrug transport system fused ATPase/permease subunit
VATATPASALRTTNLRLLADLLRPHRRTLALGILLGLATTAVGLATPLAVKQVLDSLGADGGLGGPVALLLVLLVLGTVASFAQTLLLGRMAEQVVFDVRTSLVRRFVHGVLGDVRRHPSGELVSRVTSDTVLLREAAASSVVQLVNGVVALVGTIALMAVLDLQLLGSTLVAVFGVAAVMALLLPRISAAQRRAQDALGALGAGLEGTVGALRTVKAAGAEDRQVAALTAAARTSRDESVRAVRTTAVVWTVAGGGIQLAIIAILGIGAWRVADGDLAVSTLVAFLLYVFQLLDPVTSLTQALTALQSGLAAASRIREVEQVRQEDPAAHPAARDPHAGAAPVPVAVPGAPLLRVVDVAVTYPGAGTPALDGLSFEVPRRGHVAIAGLSGAGKTTAFSLVLRFLDPDRGRLELDGVPYDRLSLADVRSRIAYVEQETPLVTGTLRDNLVLRHPDAGDDEVWDALAAVRLDAVVRRLPDGLDTRLTASDLSGGERQRVALARAVVRPTELLLLDEATAQLDGLTEAAVQEVIARAADHGAVLTIAHRLSTIVEADRILLMEAGRLRAAGRHADLLAADEQYAELVAALRITDVTPTTPSLRVTFRRP